jgi:hypothetical protein
MIVGVLAFGGTCAVVAGGPEEGGGQVLSLVGAAGALLQLGLYFVVPRLIRDNATRQAGPGDQKLVQAYQTGLIVGLALLEGAAFFNLVAYMVEKQWWTITIVAALLFWMLLAFPTRTRVTQWLESRQAFDTSP